MIRAELEQAWLRLTRVELPALAGPRSWPIRNDHCFQRVLLDTACGCCWYDSIPARPAYRHAPEAVLVTAVALGRAVIAGQVDLAMLNRQSLGWRGKRDPRLGNPTSPRPRAGVQRGTSAALRC